MAKNVEITLTYDGLKAPIIWAYGDIVDPKVLVNAITNATREAALRAPDFFSEESKEPLGTAHLKSELYRILELLDLQIQQIEKEAERNFPGCEAHQLRNMQGEWFLTPILIARVQALSALAHLENQKGTVRFTNHP